MKCPRSAPLLAVPFLFLFAARFPEVSGALSVENEHENEDEHEDEHEDEDEHDPPASLSEALRAGDEQEDEAGWDLGWTPHGEGVGGWLVWK